MTDQTAAIEVWARVLCAADAHVHGYPTWQQLPTTPGPSGRSQDDYRKVATWLLPRMTVADPAGQAPAADRAGLMRAHVALAEQAGRDQAAIARVRRLHDQLETDTGLASPDDEITRGAAARKIAAALDGWTPPADAVLPAPADRAACPDPIECGHEAALGQAREETRRLGLMVDEYGAGASALTDKLRRARERHRETCILARGEVKPKAFRCGLCEVLDAPAAPLRRMADEAQQPSLAVEDCTCIPFTRQGGVQRYCQPGDTVDMISGWEIGGDCPHHRDAVKAQQALPTPVALAALYRELAEEASEWGGVITEHELRRKASIAARGADEPAAEAQQPKEARS